MPVVSVDEFLQSIAFLADHQNLRANMKQSGKGGLIAGACTFIGGVVAGPIGLAVGGTIGGLAAYKLTEGFKPISEIIRNDLTPEQKQMLYDRIVRAVQMVELKDVCLLLPLIMEKATLQYAALSAAVIFIQDEMRATIADC